MSIHPAHATAFFVEAVANGAVFTIRDGAGFPAPVSGDGQRAMPFWSLESRARRVVTTVAAYRDFVVVSVPIAEFREQWLSGLEDDRIAVGLNWSGDRAAGFDLTPDEVRAGLDTRRDRRPPRG